MEWRQIDPKKDAHERSIWRLFRRLNDDSAYSYFRKSERPDFRNRFRGVELMKFIQDFYGDPNQGDHFWELLYQQFSKICNERWRAAYPGRPLPISVSYVPKSDIRHIKGRDAFRLPIMYECADEFVDFASRASVPEMFLDSNVALAGKLMGKYFQLVSVTPFKSTLYGMEKEHYRRRPGWGYPQSGGGISVGSRIEELVKKKALKVSNYPNRMDSLDFLLYADGQTLASKLMPWAESELKSQPIDHGPFSTIWLLDVPGRKLFKAIKL
jgi:hypothetical protein